MILRLCEQKDLDEYLTLAPAIDAVVSRMMGIPPYSISRCLNDSWRGLTEWSVFEDGAGRGAGILLHPHVPHATVLQRRFARLQQTRLLAGALESILVEGEFYFREDGVCPATWRMFHVEVGGKHVGCAVSYPVPQVTFPSERKTLSGRVVTMPLCVTCGWSRSLAVGNSQSITEVAFTLGEGDIRGILVCCEDGMLMKPSGDVMREKEELEIERLPVRLDLGEVHLSIEQLLGMRRGMQLLLESNFPSRCFLRVGMSAVAEAVLEREADGMRLTIVDLV